MNQTITDTISRVDETFLFTFLVAAFFFLLITVCMVVFVILFNHKRNPDPADIPGHNLLEIIWIVVPSIIVIGMFYSGWQSYMALRTVPEDAVIVDVTARKWAWLFTYENGRTSPVLYAPVNRPIKVNILSEDVIHSFYAPAFRIKRDAVPGMRTYAWFKPEKEGSYDVMCAEYCGLGHSAMVTRITVLAEEKFREWYEHGGEEMEHPGLDLFVKFGCNGCHPLGDFAGVGPRLQGIYERRVTVLTGQGEEEMTADEAYLRRAIEQPALEVVKGYAPVMPDYSGRMTAAELEQLVEFLQTFQQEGAGD